MLKIQYYVDLKCSLVVSALLDQHPTTTRWWTENWLFKTDSFVIALPLLPHSGSVIRSDHFHYHSGVTPCQRRWPPPTLCLPFPGSHKSCSQKRIRRRKKPQPWNGVLPNEQDNDLIFGSLFLSWGWQESLTSTHPKEGGDQLNLRILVYGCTQSNHNPQLISLATTRECCRIFFAEFTNKTAAVVASRHKIRSNWEKPCGEIWRT